MRWDWRRINLEYWELGDSDFVACVHESDIRRLEILITDDDDLSRETYYFRTSRGLKSSVFRRLIAEKQRATRERENRRPRISVIKLPARVARLDAIRARHQVILAASRRSRTYRGNPSVFRDIASVNKRSAETSDFHRSHTLRKTQLVTRQFDKSRNHPLRIRLTVDAFHCIPWFYIRNR